MSATTLYCGVSENVCRKEWFNQCGNKVKAIHSAKISVLDNNYVTMQTDINENDMQLLFSKSSVKRAEMADFQNDITNGF